jgi:hypothetical protein
MEDGGCTYLDGALLGEEAVAGGKVVVHNVCGVRETQYDDHRKIQVILSEQRRARDNHGE